MTFGETMALLSAPGVGPLRHAATLSVGVAGTESNVAIGAQRLDASAAWMGRVGDDEFGLMVLARVGGEGIDVDAASVDSDAPTGLMIKATRAAGRTQVLYYRRGSAASRLRPEHLDEQRIRSARVLHVTGITAALSASARETVFSAIENARDAGVLVSFDPNHRDALWDREEARPVLRDLAGRADIVLAGRDEAAMMLGDGEPATLAGRLHDGGAAQAIVKLGSEGAVACIEGAEHRADAPAVVVVDPVGAGDGFAAGYLTALLEGLDPKKRLHRAAVVAAFAVSAHGDWEGLPRRDELGLLARGGDVAR